VRMVIAKKEKISNALISENVYQPEDRLYLLDLPLKILEDLLEHQKQNSKKE
jgi:hypothetical protein